MSLRFEDIGRIATVAICTLLACSEKSDNNTGVAGASSGGTSAAGSASGSGGGGASSMGGMLGASGSASGAATGGGGTSNGGSGGSASSGGSAGSGGAAGKSKTTFFVTSDTRATGKFGSLETSDKRCQDLAAKAGIADHTFHAYLSTSTANAKDRIGRGPWVNSAGVVVAADLGALHSGNLAGNPDLFIDENKLKIHGQWDGGPNEHDILTGSKADGTVQPGATCQDWTSDADGDRGQVGHSDGMGQGKTMVPPANSWNSAHLGGSCGDTSQSGGAGRIYCFAID